MSNEVAVYALRDMQTMAQAVAKSGLFGMKSEDQALALMLVAQAEGQHPATITQDYDIIQGKACRKTHSVMARFQQMGGKVEWHQLTDQIAEATFSHPAGGALRIEWTIDQAKKAGLTGKDNWKNYPRAMLRARVIAEGVRAVYPAAIGGMMIAEEATDSPQSDTSDSNTIQGAAREVKEERPTLPTMDKDEVIMRYGTDVLDGDTGEVTKFSKKSLIQQGEAKAQTLIDFLAAKVVLTEDAIKEIKSWEKGDQQ